MGFPVGSWSPTISDRCQDLTYPTFITVVLAWPGLYVYSSISSLWWMTGVQDLWESAAPKRGFEWPPANVKMWPRMCFSVPCSRNFLCAVFMCVQ